MTIQDAPRAVRDTFQSAAAAYGRGDLRTAESLCELLVTRKPPDFDGLHLLGVLHLQTGRLARGLQLVDAALALRPDDMTALASRGNGLLALGQPAAALDAFDRALSLQPDRASHHNNRGNALQALGRTSDAVLALERAVQLDPKRASARTNLGNALLTLGRPKEALECHLRALALNPKLPEAWANRANVLVSMRRPAEALESYRKALEMQPGLLRARNGVCVALLELHRPQDALAFAEELLALAPGEPKTIVNCAAALRALGRKAEALDMLKRAAAGSSAAPDFDLLSALGNQQYLNDQLPAAEETFRELLRAAPGYAYAIGRLVDTQLHSCNWQGLAPLIEQIHVAVQEGRPATTPFSLAALPSTPAEQKRCAEALVQQMAFDDPVFLPSSPRAPGQRLRVAYLSPDFREHPVANQICGLLEAHDRTQVEVIGVALEGDDGSAAGRRSRAACDQFIEASLLADEQIVSMLRELRVDIAVDLAGHTLGNRIGLFAHRLAPAQVNFLGYPGTLGTAFHDYIVADWFVIPTGHEIHYSERVVRLPGSYQPYDPQPGAQLLHENRQDAGLPDDAVVFCCFNNRFKISPRIFDVWMQILSQVPGSVLWLVRAPDAAMENLRREAVARGVAAERIIFAERKVARDEHIARYALADLFLDTLPFNAHATASDALWAGLPVLTCLGEAFAGRVAAGMLHATGLPELVTTNMEDYTGTAVRLALQPQALRALRERLASDRASLPMFDLPRYCRNLEEAYLRMSALHSSGQAPMSFCVGETAGT